jgi:hypothetical protein
MIEEKTFTSDYHLEDVKEANGKFYFTATSLDNNFECEIGRAILSKKSVGKGYIWRHQHPIQEGNEDTHIYGEVVASRINDNGYIESKYEVYGHTKDHLALRDDIKERQRVGKPLGVSMRYRKYYVGDKILHMDVFEHSGTPFPKCTNCKNINFIGEEKVPDKEEKKDKEKEIELEGKDLQESLKKIGELENQLNSRTKIFEEMKTKVETLEAELEDKVKKLEETEKTEKTLEEQVEDLKNEVIYLIKKPLIDKIKEVKKLDDRELEFLKDQDEKYLNKKLEQWSKESESKIHVESQEESAEKAKKHADKEFEEKEPSMKKFTQHIKHKVKIKEKDEDKK